MSTMPCMFIMMVVSTASKRALQLCCEYSLNSNVAFAEPLCLFLLSNKLYVVRIITHCSHETWESIVWVGAQHECVVRGCGVGGCVRCLTEFCHWNKLNVEGHTLYLMAHFHGYCLFFLEISSLRTRLALYSGS